MANLDEGQQKKKMKALKTLVKRKCIIKRTKLVSGINNFFTVEN